MRMIFSLLRGACAILLLAPACAGNALPADQSAPAASTVPPVASSLHPVDQEPRTAQAEAVVAPVKRVRPAKRDTRAKQQPVTTGAKPVKASARSLGGPAAPSLACKPGAKGAKGCAEPSTKSIKVKGQKMPAAKPSGGKSAPGVVRARAR